MDKREDRRISMTKRMLKEAMTELLREKDIYHIAVRELCERADVNRTTFYKHYGNQFDLLDEMELDLLCSVEKMIKSSEKYGESAITKLLAFLEEDIEFVRLLLNSNVDPEFPKKLFSLAIVSNSINDNLANVSKEEHDYVFNFVLTGAYEMVRLWVNMDDRLSVEEMGKIILKRLYLNFGIKFSER